MRKACEDLSRKGDVNRTRKKPAQNQDESLLKLFSETKKLCFAPIVLVSGSAIQEVTAGHYLDALMKLGTASGLTLILIVTISIGSLIIRSTETLGDRRFWRRSAKVSKATPNIVEVNDGGHKSQDANQSVVSVNLNAA